MKKLEENIIVVKTLRFALDIIRFTERLEEQKKYLVARQILKSGTSIGANVRESQNAESRADFVHKLKVAAKEADETDYWLTLCNCSENYPYEEFLHQNLNEIQKILNRIITTSRTSIIKQTPLWEHYKFVISKFVISKLAHSFHAIST